MPYKDLREFIKQLDEIGHLIRLDGVHWDGEVGQVDRLTRGRNAVLMDNFPGYPPGYRVLVNLLAGGLEQTFLSLNWSSDKRGLELIKAYREHLKEFKPVPPKWVKTGPIMENVSTGKDVNVLKFPVPKWQEDDGGRYIGTQGIEILKDPETGRFNAGTYRMQVHDKATLGIYISEGKDGNIIREKYFSEGKPCPIVAVFGIDPGLARVGPAMIVHTDGVSELDYAGWIKGMPEEVIRGQFTGLPIPANAEIAIEGEMIPGDMQMEGPFGEATGYSEARIEPVVRVKALYHRNDPILTGRTPLCNPPGSGESPIDFQASAEIWNQMESVGVREIKGVASYGRIGLRVVSIANSYAGHARQAGLIASQCQSYFCRWVIVVDEWIDPTSLNDVLWVTTTRSDARRAVQVLDYLWSSHMSLIDPSRPFITAEYPLIPSRATYRSGVVIDACWPVEWDRRWHRIIKPNPKVEKRVNRKFGHLLKRD